MDTQSAASPNNPPQKRLWSPVRARLADGYWIVLIASMSVTIIVTRVYLELTGYPQVGDSTFHVAHVLWGGLAMFIALVLPLSMMNPYVAWVTAVLGGIGAGLFVDEVGKFITQSNDYFFPLAFPIIYAFIIVCVWLVFRIRARQHRNTRTLLYHALDDIKQVLDNDLDPYESKALVSELSQVLQETDDTEERALAEALLSFTQNRNVRLRQSQSLATQWWLRARSRAASSPSRVVLRVVLIVCFSYMALNALGEIATFGVLLFSQAGRQALQAVLGEGAVIISGKSQYIVNNPALVAMQSFFVILTGLLALIAAILLLAGRERLALRLGTTSLVISLLIVNLLSFYFNQLYAVAETLGQAAALGIATVYRWRFLREGNARGPDLREESS